MVYAVLFVVTVAKVYWNLRKKQSALSDLSLAAQQRLKVRLVGWKAHQPRYSFTISQYFIYTCSLLFTKVSFLYVVKQST